MVTDDEEDDAVDVMDASKIKEMPCKEDDDEDKTQKKGTQH